MNQIISSGINRVKYTVNLDYLREMLSSITQEGKGLRKELNQIALQYGVKVDFSSSKAVARFINKFVLCGEETVSRITSETLDYWFEKSKDDFYIKLKNYRRCREKYKKIVTFVRSLSIAYNESGSKCISTLMESNLRRAIIYPLFAINKIGEISITKPAMPFSVIEMMRLLAFNMAIEFATNDEMVGFMKEYDDIIQGYTTEKYCLMAGKVLYAQMMLNTYDIIPFSDNEDEIYRLIKQFNLIYRNKLKLDSRIIIED